MSEIPNETLLNPLKENSQLITAIAKPVLVPELVECELVSVQEDEVTIPSTKFWKLWNTLGDLERFFQTLDRNELSPGTAEEVDELLESVGWRMNNLITEMQSLKDRETYGERNIAC
jgi:hypothetical protein